MSRRLLRSKWGFSAIFLVVASSIVASPIGPQSRSPQDIALAFGIPFLLFDTVVPYSFAWLLSIFVPRERKVSQPRLPFQAYSRTVRVTAISVVAVAGVTFMLIAFSVALWMASFLYPLLRLDWAVAPARHFAKICIVLGLFPLAILLSFLAGVASARYVSNLFSPIFEQSIVERIMTELSHRTAA